MINYLLYYLQLEIVNIWRKKTISICLLVLLFQSTAIGHRGVPLNLVLNHVVGDKRHEQELAQTQHRNIMEPIVKEVLRKQILAITNNVQVCLSIFSLSSIRISSLALILECY